MADAHDNGFGKFIPGFDFLQNLAKGASQTVPQMPGLGSWVAPTLNEEELDKRISELKAVHFWLDQNSRALGATVQALEVQKLTLATLKGMSLNISEMANAFKPKAPETSAAAEVQKTPDKPTVVAQPTAAETSEQTHEAATTDAPAPKGMVDSLQMWTALTQQFQQIAASAMKDVGNATAVDQSEPPTKGVSAKSSKTSSGEAAPPAKKRTVAKKAVKKSAPTAAAERAVRRRT